MKKHPLKTVIVLNLVALILAQLYFGTVFNESVRHPLDLLAMLYASAGLVLNHIVPVYRQKGCYSPKNWDGFDVTYNFGVT